MRQLIYALRFRGEAKQVGIDGAVLMTATSAPGCMIGTRIGPEGVSGSLHSAAGDEASLESEWVFTGTTTFQEVGTIVFGQGGHRLRFSTFGSAYLGPRRTTSVVTAPPSGGSKEAKVSSRVLAV